MEQSPKVKNIKGHVQVSRLAVNQLTLSLKGKRFKQYHNFLCVYDRYTYIIFPKRMYVNITGVKNFEELPSVIPNFCKDFNIDIGLIESNFVIDNLTASGHFGKSLNLADIQEYLNEGESPPFTVSYDRDIFPGAYCKHRLGTISLFATGRFNILGVKCSQEIEEVFTSMLAITNKLSTTTERDAKFAPNVGRYLKPFSEITQRARSTHVKKKKKTRPSLNL
jgi:TATA-box binding protein (TBP) (component of TFIID and TFIIIB)